MDFGRPAVQLMLNDNKIGDAGARALAEVLSANSSLRELQLQGNTIGEAGAEALARAISTNGTLKWVCDSA